MEEDLISKAGGSTAELLFRDFLCCNVKDGWWGKGERFRDNFKMSNLSSTTHKKPVTVLCMICSPGCHVEDTQYRRGSD